MEVRDEYFQQRLDAAHRIGLSLFTKCMVALRQLAYGTTADMFDEYLHVEDTTRRECLAKFCEGVVDAFSNTYLRKPNAADCQFPMKMHGRVHVFPGMLGSIDCPRVDDWSDNEDGPSAGHATPPVIRGLPYGVNERLQAEENMRNRQAHLQLMTDVVEEVLAHSGH
ncbi:uncharacterized protein LOC121796501 [Salvia splendens]|uniref:uncharacterized protein LOC121796501 n=1 Tax=Salvia splendens TaxID=180675 RepID=UPI001C2552A8|nr:uncharacterized protein LOC121796501 [Salvia splendens]